IFGKLRKRILGNKAQCSLPIGGGKIKVIHKANGGVSSARNLGIDNATGKWIAFIDSDDWIEPRFLESVVCSPDADLIIGTATKIEVNNRHFDLSIDQSYNSTGRTKLLEDNLDALILRTPWAKLFRKELIGDLRFRTDFNIGEDTIFVLDYLLNASKITLAKPVADASYCYVMASDYSEWEKKYYITTSKATETLTETLKSYFKLKIKAPKLSFMLVNFYHSLCKADMHNSWRLWYHNPLIFQARKEAAACLGIKGKVGLHLSFLMPFVNPELVLGKWLKILFV
ncbi:MAG: glycosyltransferase family 2 protein, partial [Muribaculaceae bacterium]